MATYAAPDEILPIFNSSVFPSAITPAYVDLTSAQSIGGVKTFSSALRISNGTFSLPSISFAADTSTGIWSPAGGFIGFSSAGNNRMAIADQITAFVPIYANGGIRIGESGSTTTVLRRGATTVPAPGSNGTTLIVTHNLGVIPTNVSAIMYNTNNSANDVFAVTCRTMTATTATFRIWRVDTNAAWGGPYDLHWTVSV